MRRDIGTRTGTDESDTFEMEGFGGVRERIGRLVPQTVARQGLTVDVESDDSTYHADEPIALAIKIRNRLPMPVSLVVEGKRLWGWSVDGHVGASDEPLYASAVPRRLDLHGFEARQLRREWDGRIKRRGSPSRWERAERGDHEIVAFVPTVGGAVTGSTTVTIEP